MILAKKLKRLVRRRNALVSEGIDSRLPCRHAVVIVLVVRDSTHGYNAAMHRELLI
jgi:hypothetical protein